MSELGEMGRIQLTRICANIQIPIQVHTVTRRGFVYIMRCSCRGFCFNHDNTKKELRRNLRQCYIVSIQIYWVQPSYQLRSIISCSLLWQMLVSSWHRSMLRLTSNDSWDVSLQSIVIPSTPHQTYRHSLQTGWQPLLTSSCVRLSSNGTMFVQAGPPPSIARCIDLQPVLTSAVCVTHC